MTGTQPLVWSQIFKNWKFGFAAFFGQNTLFKTRPLVGFIHALVAWGFSLYLAVNVIDVVYGFVPNFKFLPESLIGDVYRLFVDIFSVLVLLGVFYFLLRRFLLNDSRLVIDEPVMLSEKAKRVCFLIRFLLVRSLLST